MIGWLILRNSRHERSSENQVEVTVLGDTITLVGKLPFTRDSPSQCQEEGGDLFSRNSYQCIRQ